MNVRTAALVLSALHGATAIEEWCAAAPLPSVHSIPLQKAGSQFRGAFRDLTLYIHEEKALGAACKDFDIHKQGNDGLWVLEFESPGAMMESATRAKKLGVPVLLMQNGTYIASGGEEVPDRLGYDACGADLDKRMMSVSDTQVLGPKPMSQSKVDSIKNYIKTKHDSITDAVSRVTEESLMQSVAHLQEYHSRNSNSPQLVDATAWLADQFELRGAFVTRHAYSDWPANVVAEFKGTGSEIIVVGAHADSRATNTNSATQRAPGADDNGTGTAALLEIADAIRKSGIKLKATVRLISFTGEEQGLVGSRAIARAYSASRENIVAMVNGDMLGYRIPETNATVAFMNRYADMTLTELAMDVTSSYVPELGVGWTSGCCSDQQSFYENGFPSVGFFEHPGSAVNYPHYHKETDLLEYIDLKQLELETKAMLATVLVLADAE
eukprot:TRINITY_DN896_c2_g2_i1.p1 TRINITY_DN896_c2_g2~~TRINITY_DN896_c2_g2_i1.p1  ORF type:complete len:440 (+),score=115.51 TRINITY_DN896_c2_g2_i1:56-1375(+)